MALEPDAPRNQYAKMQYHIRLVAQIPRHAPGANGEEVENAGLQLRGMGLCAIDVTMSHTAVMYAAGRLLDSIREPFNASVIRAEMDTLRCRGKAGIVDEGAERDPLVGNITDDTHRIHISTPRCAYLSQLLHKSFYIGNEPAFWVGAREDTSLVRNIHGRSGQDSFAIRRYQLWHLYVDVSDPLRPRYAFMDETHFLNGTDLRKQYSSRNPKPLRIFNAREHAYRFMIPESEFFSEAEKFGEKPWARHVVGIPPEGGRTLARLPQHYQSRPEYMALLESRMERAREHTAVVLMNEFGWLKEQDVIKSDGSALLQGVWRDSLTREHEDPHGYIVGVLLNHPAELTVVRSEALDEPDPQAITEWEYSLTGLGLEAFPFDLCDPSLKSTLFFALKDLFRIPSRKSGEVLSLIHQLSGTAVYPSLKKRLAQKLWLTSSGLGDSAYHQLHPEVAPVQASDDQQDSCNTWLASGYDQDQEVTSPLDSETSWILMYQALCYRHSVALERPSEQKLAVDSDSDSLTNTSEPKSLPDSDYPGRALGDAANPAFDASLFPHVRDHVFLNALRLWSKQIWAPGIAGQGWDCDKRNYIPLRTLNVSGCYFVTRNTIRKALKIAPSIRRIIMIGCVNFTEVDLAFLSLNGTLNNVDCILTSESVRAPFKDPSQKKAHRDQVYKEAQALLPQPPNDRVRAALESVPKVFFGSTKGFRLKYEDSIQGAYFQKGLYSRSLSHTFARPPALGFDPETHQVVCGPPRFSVVLACNAITSAPVTGAAFPRVPIDTGIDGIGTSGSGLTSIWRGIIDLLELLGEPQMRNRQRWDMIKWSLLVKSCFSGPGKKWGHKSGNAGGGEFYGFPAYFKGCPGQANEEWIFAYGFRDVIQRIQTEWYNRVNFSYPEAESRDTWGFIRYGRDANPISHEVPTIVLYNVREFRQAICPNIPIGDDEEKWIARVEELLTNGVWKRQDPIINHNIDRDWAAEGNPFWERLHSTGERLIKPQFLRGVPQELLLLVERMMTCQMNKGTDIF